MGSLSQASGKPPARLEEASPAHARDRRSGALCKGTGDSLFDAPAGPPAPGGTTQFEIQFEVHFEIPVLCRRGAIQFDIRFEAHQHADKFGAEGEIHFEMHLQMPSGHSIINTTGAGGRMYNLRCTFQCIGKQLNIFFWDTYDLAPGGEIYILRCILKHPLFGTGV